MLRGEAPCDQTAEVVPDHVNTLRPNGIDQSADVLHQFRHPILAAATRPRAGRHTSLVRHHASKPRSDEVRYDGLPGGVGLRMTVQEDRYWRVDRPGGLYIEEQ